MRPATSAPTARRCAFSPSQQSRISDRHTACFKKIERRLSRSSSWLQTSSGTASVCPIVATTKICVLTFHQSRIILALLSRSSTGFCVPRTAWQQGVKPAYALEKIHGKPSDNEERHESSDLPERWLRPGGGDQIQQCDAGKNAGCGCEYVVERVLFHGCWDWFEPAVPASMYFSGLARNAFISGCAQNQTVSPLQIV